MWKLIQVLRVDVFVNMIIQKNDFYLVALYMLFQTSCMLIQNDQYAFKKVVLNPYDKVLMKVI